MVIGNRGGATRVAAARTLAIAAAMLAAPMARGQEISQRLDAIESRVSALERAVGSEPAEAPILLVTWPLGAPARTMLKSVGGEQAITIYDGDIDGSGANLDGVVDRKIFSAKLSSLPPRYDGWLLLNWEFVMAGDLQKDLGDPAFQRACADMAWLVAQARRQRPGCKVAFYGIPLTDPRATVRNEQWKARNALLTKRLVASGVSAIAVECYDDHEGDGPELEQFADTVAIAKANAGGLPVLAYVLTRHRPNVGQAAPKWGHRIPDPELRAALAVCKEAGATGLVWWNRDRKYLQALGRLPETPEGADPATWAEEAELQQLTVLVEEFVRQRAAAAAPPASATAPAAAATAPSSVLFSEAERALLARHDFIRPAGAAEPDGPLTPVRPANWQQFDDLADGENRLIIIDRPLTATKPAIITGRNIRITARSGGKIVCEGRPAEGPVTQDREPIIVFRGCSRVMLEDIEIVANGRTALKVPSGATASDVSLRRIDVSGAWFALNCEGGVDGLTLDGFASGACGKYGMYTSGSSNVVIVRSRFGPSTHEHAMRVYGLRGALLAFNHFTMNPASKSCLWVAAGNCDVAMIGNEFVGGEIRLGDDARSYAPAARPWRSDDRRLSQRLLFACNTLTLTGKTPIEAFRGVRDCRILENRINADGAHFISIWDSPADWPGEYAQSGNLNAPR
jgi:hypothetical protein